jgi:hypothetical protein
MIPRFCNPHLLVQSTQPTSRAELSEAEDADTSHDTQLIETLVNISKHSLGDFSTNVMPDSRKRKIEMLDTTALRVSSFFLFFVYSDSNLSIPLAIHFTPSTPCFCGTETAATFEVGKSLPGKDEIRI